MPPSPHGNTLHKCSTLGRPGNGHRGSAGLPRPHRFHRHLCVCAQLCVSIPTVTRSPPVTAFQPHAPPAFPSECLAIISLAPLELCYSQNVICTESRSMHAFGTGCFLLGMIQVVAPMSGSFLFIVTVFRGTDVPRLNHSTR